MVGFLTMIEETNKPNEFGTALEQWWDSDACKHLQEASRESIQKAVGKYHMLSEEDKYDMVGGIFYIICEAEEKGVSHRGLMNELGIYPSGFWISKMMDVHNALYEYYDKRKQKQELDKDIKTLKSFLDEKDK
jgi:hypothetical protein